LGSKIYVNFSNEKANWVQKFSNVKTTHLVIIDEQEPPLLLSLLPLFHRIYNKVIWWGVKL